MNIYILRDGEKMGPFSDEAVRTLIQQGDMDEEDLACREGDSEWDPVRKVLETTTPAPVDPPPAESTEPENTEPATAQQLAFLSYFEIPTPAGLLKEAADELATKATEDPRNARRLLLWKVDRLRLHPDLFPEEVRAKKENRAQFFHTVCQAYGADYFTGVTKAHCQVLVAFLDVAFPRWDAKESEAAEKYFFPAVAEKFPQLVNKTWRGRFHYGHGVTAAVSKSPTAKLMQEAASPIGAFFRGLLLGLGILGLLYVGYVGTHGWNWRLGIPAPAPGMSEQSSAISDQ